MSGGGSHDLHWMLQDASVCLCMCRQNVANPSVSQGRQQRDADTESKGMHRVQQHVKTDGHRVILVLPNYSLGQSTLYEAQSNVDALFWHENGVPQGEWNAPFAVAHIANH